MSQKQELDPLFSYGVDFAKRRIYFGTHEGVDDDDDNAGNFNWKSVENAIRGLHRLVAINSKKPIELHMSSYGGDIYMMLRLYDEILACPCQIKFIGSGVVFSSATWIMAVCDERYLHSNTTVMVHYGNDGESGKSTDVQIDAKEGKRLQNLLDDLYVNNSHMPKKFWKNILQRDVYLTAEEAVLIGLADKILPTVKRGNLRQKRRAHMNKPPSKGKLNALMKRISLRMDSPEKFKEITINVPGEELFSPDIIVDEESADNQEVLKETVSDEKDNGKN